MKRHLLHTLTTVAVVSCLFFTPVMAAPQEDVETLEQKKSQAEAQAASVNDELVALLVDYNALQADITSQEKKIRQAEKDLRSAEKKEKKQYEDMKLRIKYMYEEGDASFVTALIGAESYSELVSKAEYVQKVHDYDRKMLDRYVKTKNEVAELKDGLEAGEAEMQELSAEMGRQKSNLESTLTTMKAQISDFDSQLEQAKEAAAEEMRRIEEEQEAASEDADAPEIRTPDEEDGEGVGKEDPGQEDPEKEEPKKEESKKEETKKEEKKEPEKEESKKEEPKKEEPEEKAPSVPGNASLGQQIADMGCQYVGNKYVYGGNSLTNGIDCSGFVYQIHKKFGITTPRSSGDIRSGGKSVSYADKLPGDVICYSGHVAIYIGNNQIVHASNSAPYPKGGIKISSPANYRTVLAVRRYW